MRFADYYYELCSIVDSGDMNARNYSKLFSYLYSVPFRWTVKNDSNRASDGIRLRASIVNDARMVEELGPCRMLEMMIALANRCETDIMQEDQYGNRTGIWFWTMVENLGLITMDDWNYDEETVRAAVNRFLDRKYSRNGYGSIFFANDHGTDLRKAEIWYQMCWFLTEQYDFAI